MPRLKTPLYFLSLLALLSLSAGCLIRIGPLAAGISAAPGESPPEVELSGIRIDQHVVEIEIADDLTFSGITSIQKTLLTPAGVLSGQKTTRTFDPRTQSLDVVEAWVAGDDGQRVQVTAENIFTRPSRAAQQTPGFVQSLTTTVIFPQLRVGSQTFIKWRFRERGRSVLGFNYVYQPEYFLDLEKASVHLTLPSSVPLRWEERGGFKVTEKRANGETQVTATLERYAGGLRERNMPAPKDLAPTFVASTLGSWEEIGARFHEFSQPKIVVSPEIKTLAERLTRGQDALQAAQTLYRWVCRNIHYVAVYLDTMDTWTPHPAPDVLRRGYGDCKDQYVLLASLLQARGIRSHAVLIDSRPSFQPLPLWAPQEFNHCLLFLPDLGLFANPTNPYADLGTLTTNLSGKFVVHATPKGSIGRTPEGKEELNRYFADHELRISSDGTVTGSSQLDFEGRVSQRYRAVMASSSGAVAVADNILLETPEGGTGSLSSTDPTDLDVPFRCQGDWNSPAALEMDPTVFFTTPVGLDFANPHQAHKYISARRRETPLIISAIEISWRFKIELPEGYAISVMPRNRRLRNRAGRYVSEYRQEGPSSLTVTRTLVIAKDVFSPEEYDPLRQLLYETTHDGRSVFVLRASEQPE